MNRSKILLPLAAFALLLASPRPADAQSAGNFLITVTEGGDSRLASNGQLLQFRSLIGRPTLITIDIAYNGPTSGDFGLANLVGSPDFRFLTAPPVPVSIQPGQRITFSIEFTPTSTKSTLSQLAVTARELPPAGSDLPPGNFGLLFLGLVGTAPEVQFAYALRTNSNVVPVASGGTLVFEPTNINTQAFSSVFAFNQGSAFANVESVRLEGDSSFQLLELPFLPASLGANSSLRFQIRYWPRDMGSHSATLTVSADGVTSTITVTGSAQGPAWIYELIPESSEQEPFLFEPDSTVALPDTLLGRRTTVWIRVTNAGNFDGEIAGIGVLGQGLSLLDPPFTPLIVKPERSLTFGIVFSAQQAGRITGRLRIGSDFFNLAVTALGAQLQYSYSAASSGIQVNPGGLVVLPSTAAGQSTMALFTIENTGNQAATIPSVGLSGANTAYSLEDLPPLPLILEPEQKASFRIVFRPTQPGPATDILSAGTAFFNLTGSAAALPPLPSYSFGGPSGSVEPLRQPTISLTLNQPYPVALRGTLTISTDTANFGADPSVQFSTGGRVVNFTIPANTNQAVFANSSTSIRIQTGSSAGTILITPSFRTDSGIDRTPESPLILSLNVPARVPEIVGLRMETGSSSIQFVITGYSTPRDLTTIQLTIQRDRHDDASYVFDVSASSNIWFNSGGSQGFGGLFTAVVPFQVVGSVDDFNKLVDELRSAAAIVSNSLGASQTATLTLK